MKKIKQIFFSKKNLKRDISVTILFFIASITAVSAGNLDSPGSPSSTMYTLGNIYQRLITNQEAQESDHLFSPASNPASSFHTLKEIYEAIPTIDPTKIKTGTNYLGISGTLIPSSGTAGAADLFGGKTANLTDDWDLDTGTLNLACNISIFDGTENKISDSYDGGGNGNNRWCITDSATAVAADILSGKKAWVDGVEITGTADIFSYGDSFADQVLMTADAPGTYDAENISAETVKKGISFGVSETGEFSGYPGTGWEPNESGDGSVALNQANCESAANWKWFEDANGDGDTTDSEDGECVLTATVVSSSWNGAEQVTPNNLGTVASPIVATGGSASSITVSGAS